MLQLARNPKFWLAGFSLWLGSLWVSSSFSHVGTYMPPVNHVDKVVHFAYFLGGGGLWSAYLFCRNPANPDWWRIFIAAVSVVAAVGILDEWHQSFTLGRSGNDPYDWIADLLGGSSGALIFRRMHHLLK